MTSAPPSRYSACIELLFADNTPSYGDRIRRAAAAGFAAVEFWSWGDKDLADIESALAETGVGLAAMIAEPMLALTDPANHAQFLDGLRATIATARRLGAANLIGLSGNTRPGVPRDLQRRAVVDALSRAADLLAGTGIALALEPLNDRIDHKGYFLASTVEALDTVDAVGRPEVKLLYDIYHSAVMGEATDAVIGTRASRIAHVHLADHPGRHEPGTGKIDWRERIVWLRRAGYAGLIGLEYKPTGRPIPDLP
ncbi:MAG: TIM barrel protein [Cucumibacter sp.]